MRYDCGREGIYEAQLHALWRESKEEGGLGNLVDDLGRGGGLRHSTFVEAQHRPFTVTSVHFLKAGIRSPTTYLKVCRRRRPVLRPDFIPPSPRI